MREAPRSVSEYSTFGGICGYSVRAIRPSRSSSFRFTDSVLVRDAPQVAAHLVETHGLVFHQAIEDYHLVLPLDEGQRIAVAGLGEVGLGDGQRGMR